jgi:hypothetical protein
MLQNVPHPLPIQLHAQVLHRGDVLTHLDGIAIADDGTFLFREAVRIDHRHLPSCAFDGDSITVSPWGWRHRGWLRHHLCGVNNCMVYPMGSGL